MENDESLSDEALRRAMEEAELAGHVGEEAELATSERQADIQAELESQRWRLSGLAQAVRAAEFEEVDLNEVDAQGYAVIDESKWWGWGEIFRKYRKIIYDTFDGTNVF